MQSTLFSPALNLYLPDRNINGKFATLSHIIVPSAIAIPNRNTLFTLAPTSTSLRSSSKYGEIAKIRRRSGAVCYAMAIAPRDLQWFSAVCTAVLMFTRGTAIQKSFLVPLFALQAPGSIISWMKGEYGVWTAFLALLVRLFFFIPGELELPFVALLLVIVAPYDVMKLRGRQEGTVISLVIASYLAFQHFSRLGSLQKAFDQGPIIATIAIVCITAVSCLLLI